MIVGVDPEGSILAEPDSLNDKNKLEPYHVEVSQFYTRLDEIKS